MERDRLYPRNHTPFLHLLVRTLLPGRLSVRVIKPLALGGSPARLGSSPGHPNRPLYLSFDQAATFCRRTALAAT
jgi:hypothetical protein